MTSPGALIFTVDHDQYLHARESEACRDALLAVADLASIASEERAGRAYVNLWDYLDASLAEDGDREAWQLCDAIADACSGRAVQGGCDVISEMRYELYTPLRFALVTQAVVEAVLKDLKPEQVGAFAPMERSFVWDPPVRPPDIFNGMVAWCARENNVPCRIIEGLEVKDTLQVEWGGWQPPPRGRPDRSPAWPVRVQGLSLCPGYDFYEQEAFLQVQASHPEVGWFVVSDYRQCEDLGLPGCGIEEALELPFDTTSFDSSLNELRSAGVPASLAADYPVVRACRDTLSFVWASFCDQVSSGARSYEAGRFLAGALRPPVVFAGYDVWGARRCLMRGLRDGGCRILTNQHGGLGFVHGYQRHRRVEGGCTAWGEVDGSAIERWRSGRVYRVGTLRPDLARLRREGRPPQGLPPRQRAAPLRVILFTSWVSDFSGPLSSVGQHFRSWSSLLDLCRRRKDWTFVIKPHPRYDYHAFYQAELAEHAPGNLVLSESPSAELLEEAGCAVLFNCPSSVGVEVLTSGVPLVFYREAVFPWVKAVFEGGAIPSCEKIEDLEALLHEVLVNPETRSEVLSAQGAFMDKILPSTGGRSVEKVQAVLEELREKTGEPSGASEAAWRRALLRLNGVLNRLLAQQRGALPDLKCAARELRLALAKEDVAAGEQPNRGVLAGWLYDRLLKSFDTGRAAVSRPRLLFTLQHAFPRGQRPAWISMRRLYSQAFLQEGALRQGARPAAFLWCWFGHALAPGRWLRR